MSKAISTKICKHCGSDPLKIWIDEKGQVLCANCNGFLDWVESYILDEIEDYPPDEAN